MRQFMITEEKLIVLTNYLAEKPFREVSAIIYDLHNLPEAQFPDKENADAAEEKGK